MFDFIRTNPLIIYNAPWRRSPLHLGLALLLPILMLAAFWQFNLFLDDSITGTGTGPKSLVLVMAALLVGILLLSPLYFLAFCRDYRQSGSIEQLYLSLLTPREVVLGALFWGVVMSVVPLLLAYFGILYLAVLHPVSRYDLLYAQFPWYPRDRNFSEPPFIFASIPAILHVWAFSTSLTMLLWLRTRMVASLLYLRVVLVGIVVLVLHGQLMQDYWYGSWYRYESLFGVTFGDFATFLDGIHTAPISSLLIAILLIAVGIKASLSTAVASYFREVDPENYMRRDWAAREFASAKRCRPALKAAHKRLGVIIRHTFIPRAAMALLGTTLGMYLLSVVMGTAGFYTFFRNYPYLFCSMGILATTLMAARMHFSTASSMPVVSGSLRKSGWRWAWPTIPANLLAVLWLYLIEPNTMRPGFLFIVVVSMVVSFLLALVLIPKTNRIYWAITYLGFFILATIASIFQESSTGSWDNQRPIAGTLAFLVCLFMVEGSFIGLISVLYQRILKSEVEDHPVGMLSTDEKPAMVNEILSFPLASPPLPEQSPRPE